MREYILNTIAFAEKLSKGLKQEQLVDLVKECGFDGIEIRNEFLTGDKGELKRIRKAASACGLVIYYSVNDVIFKGGKVNSDLQGYVEQAKTLEATHVKFNLGEWRLYQGQFAKEMEGLFNREFAIHVENNQNPSQSDAKDFVAFFQEAQRVGLDITCCFDIANWYWTNTTPETAAGLLADFTDYLHLKNKCTDLRGIRTVPLLEGDIAWEELLQKFRMDIPMALEYPGSLKDIEAGLAAIKRIGGVKQSL